jgi:hypothetical protein
MTFTVSVDPAEFHKGGAVPNLLKSGNYGLALFVESGLIGPKTVAHPPSPFPEVAVSTAACSEPFSEWDSPVLSSQGVLWGIYAWGCRNGTHTATPTQTASITFSPTFSASPTFCAACTATVTSTITATPTTTPTASATKTLLPGCALTSGSTATASITASATPFSSATVTATHSPTETAVPTPAASELIFDGDNGGLWIPVSLSEMPLDPAENHTGGGAQSGFYNTTGTVVTFNGPVRQQSDFDYVELWVWPTSSDLSVGFVLTGPGGAGYLFADADAVSVGGWQVGQWNHVVIPWDYFLGSGLSLGFETIDFSGYSPSDQAFYVDDIRLVKGAIPNWVMSPTPFHTIVPGPPGCVNPMNHIGKMCPMDFSPVCGCNGVTYSNSCEANIRGVMSYTNGACGSPTPSPTVSASVTATGTETEFVTPSTTKTNTPSVTGTATRTVTEFVTPSTTKTSTPSVTSTATRTVTEFVTPSSTLTVTPSSSITATRTATQFVTPSTTKTNTPSVTGTATRSATAMVTPSSTITATPLATGTTTPSITATLTQGGPAVTATAVPAVPPAQVLPGLNPSAPTPSTPLVFYYAAAGNLPSARLVIYTSSAMIIAVLPCMVCSGPTLTFSWDGSGVGNGLYFAAVDLGDGVMRGHVAVMVAR